MSKKIRPSRLLTLILIIIVLISFYLLGGPEYLSFNYLRSQFELLKSYKDSQGLPFTLSFFGLYILITSLAIPGAIVLTLLAGALYGVASGVAIVSVASCAGACASFLMSKFMFRKTIKKAFSKQYLLMDQKIHEHGIYYLFSLRLFPASPFVIVNLVMGLTSMRTWEFCWVTFLGMLPGTIIYVMAGREFVELRSVTDAMSWPLVFSLLALSLLPYLGKFFHDHFKGGMMKDEPRLKNKLYEALRAEAGLDASSIEVFLEEGSVRLRGTVKGRESRQLAEECVRRVDEVASVLNELQIESEEAEQDLPAAISNDLERDEWLKSEKRP